MTGRLLIGAPASGNGKTTITLALMALLTSQGKRVQGFKVGPDYIDPSFHHLVTGRPSYNLDIWMGGEADVRRTFLRHSQDADISLIEGVMGLLDGVSSDANWGSSAHVAELLDCPVLLVLDIHAMARSAAAIVKGFQVLAGDATLAGVILNRVGSARHAAMVQSAIEQETGVPVLGFLRHDESVILPERHLGLVTAEETREDSRRKLDVAGQLLGENLDLDRLWRVAMADEHSELADPLPHWSRPAKRPRVAIAFDRAFNFYYPANLDLLTAMGAELLWFRPTLGERIPLGATHLYLGGGFPEEYVEDLVQHPGMMRDVRDRILSDGLPTLAECGGYMFLGEAIWSHGQRFPMVGAIPMETEMTPSLQELGYRELTVLSDGVFPSGSRFRGHAYHHSKIHRASGLVSAYAVSSARAPMAPEGHSSPTLLAGYSHLYFPSAPEAVRAWLEQGLD
ncbi:cobyrinate a,c-diamide synthase [Sulfobacillus harzensis]|uniref:cobyrinate a,c-diamide synthase n=1 Tax=Sulfobacillus harzensis TaxID=2729629 RepID=UPI001A9B0EDE